MTGDDENFCGDGRCKHCTSCCIWPSGKNLLFLGSCNAPGRGRCQSIPDVIILCREFPRKRSISRNFCFLMVAYLTALVPYWWRRRRGGGEYDVLSCCIRCCMKKETGVINSTASAWGRLVVVVWTSASKQANKNWLERFGHGGLAVVGNWGIGSYAY